MFHKKYAKYNVVKSVSEHVKDLETKLCDVNTENTIIRKQDREKHWEICELTRDIRNLNDNIGRLDYAFKFMMNAQETPICGNCLKKQVEEGESNYIREKDVLIMDVDENETI